MKYYLTLTFILVANSSITSARVGGTSPTLRACLFHDQLYAVVAWTDICDITLVDGIFGMKSSEHKDNHYVLSDIQISDRPGDIFTKVDIPHNPDCFSSEPYQQ